ncbi:MAG: hypothetical protein JWO68_3789, partial [Actinomycetia bacterium]|nr:hypothetical protein [Actinomycetes bacterium]
SRPAPTGALTAALADHLAGVTGRVLVGEAADGSLLREVAATGADAYGIEPRIELADSLALAGLDVRSDEVAAHLDDVDDDVLGGLVLAGVVDRVPLGAQVALVARAAAVLAPGGRLAVVASSPATWGTANPVEADLAPGRPLHPETWAHLLTEHGFSDVQVTGGEPVALVTAVR